MYAYGLPPVSGPGWIAYPAGRGGGVLTHGSFLSLGAKFGDTSPTVRGAETAAAAGALDAFPARYPGSPRAGEASAMLGWLVIDSDLDRAEKLFETAAKDRVSAVRASANKGLAAIEQRRKR